MNTGLIGGIAGGVIGLIGGIIGTYFSVKKTDSPRERACMIKFNVDCWIAISMFLGLMFTLPSPYRYFLWIPYSILLPWGVAYGNRQQRRIREMESQNKTSLPSGNRSTNSTPTTLP